MDATCLVERLAAAMRVGDACASELPAEALAVPGLTSTKIRHFLHALCGFPGCRYLEVGCFKGATLIASSYRQPGLFVGCDNFTYHNRGGRVTREFYKHLRRFRQECCVGFYQWDCWDLAPRLPDGCFNVFFYDGDHRHESQRNAITVFGRCLANPCILVVDDWMEPEVRAGTAEGLMWAGFRVVFELIGETTTRYEADGWWCGLYAAVISR